MAEREQAIRRRMDGLPWDGGAKSKLLPGCTGKAEIGLQEALAFDDGGEIIVVEGGPDLLAALGYFPTRGVICMASVNTDFSLTARIALRGKEVAIIPHQDEAGIKALVKWARQLGRSHVTQYELPEGYKDLNQRMSSLTVG